MTIVTGTSDFQQLFQGLLAETAIVNGEVYGVPVVKLTADSQVGGGGVASTVSVNNFPAVQNVNLVSGTISAEPSPIQGISGTVAVSNFPPIQNVNIVSGTISTLPPELQGVSGSVSINNFPSLYGISGSVAILNYPPIQGVSGSVSVSQFPLTQGISGTVSVQNFPALYNVSGSVLSMEFPTYAKWDYFGDTIYSGTSLYHGVFRNGGASGTVVATIDITYDGFGNITSVSKT